MRLLNTSTGQFSWFTDPSKVHFAILSHVWSSEGEKSYHDVLNLNKSLIYPTRIDRDHEKRILDDANTEISHQEANLSWLSRLVPSNIRDLFHHYARSLGYTGKTVFTAGSPSKSVKDTKLDVPLEEPPTLLSLLPNKVRHFCHFARERGFDWAWVDSCCIDKSSSAELSEAINSMYQWYAQAALCVAYLADVDGDEDPRTEKSQFRTSRPKDWQPLGSRSGLATVIREVTGIEEMVLLRWMPLNDIPVARRMAWAATRVTTKVEDEAYALMGIFGVHMAINYGEERYAFTRLQEEILRRIPDQSLLVWRSRTSMTSDGALSLEPVSTCPEDLKLQLASSEGDLLALSPRSFINCADIVLHLGTASGPQFSTATYTTTGYGLLTRLPVITLSDPPSGHGRPLRVAILPCFYGHDASNPDPLDRLGHILFPDSAQLSRSGGTEAYTIGYPGAWHYRVVEVPEDVLAKLAAAEVAATGQLVVSELHLRNQAYQTSWVPRGNPSDPMSWKGFEVSLPGVWRVRQLEGMGYTVDCTTTPGEDPAAPRAHQFIFTHRGSTTVTLLVDICPQCARSESRSTSTEAMRASLSVSYANETGDSVTLEPLHSDEFIHEVNHVCRRYWADGMSRAPPSLSANTGLFSWFRRYAFRHPKGPTERGTIVWLKVDPVPFWLMAYDRVDCPSFTVDVEIILDGIEVQVNPGA
ncbi:heterokaryon incompatibility protein-domain-containing protein [Trametes maxima]|nr:heterokaryon incompatibility protein-domain-containing protein [Trametes maxima]